MKMRFKSAFAAIALSIISLSTTTQAETAAPQAVDRVDIQKYVGKWYEIAHLPMYFQRKCIANITAQYSVNADQTIGVLNSCRIANGEIISSEGVAYSQNQGNSKLKVSFLPTGLRWIPFTKGHYWVLRVDPEYKVALVGGQVINTYGFCHVNSNSMKLRISPIWKLQNIMVTTSQNLSNCLINLLNGYKSGIQQILKPIELKSA